MNKVSAATGSAVFFACVPGVVAGVVPFVITRWQWGEYRGSALTALGVVLTVVGVGFLVHAFVRFVVEGSGTPAPIAPTQHLVVGGVFRYVRNPMYLAVLATILGQAAILGDPRLVVYAAVVGCAVVAFVKAYEEPTLRATYGADYEEYVRNVRGWVPRVLGARETRCARPVT